MSFNIHVVIVVTLALAASACEAEKIDAAMGARCVNPADCTDHCLMPSPEFPGGMCTLDCLNDANCPADALCVAGIAGVGGVCLYSCRDDSDCDFLGEVGGIAWTCQEQAAMGTEPGKKVCLGPGQ